jgi:hypothetical protein
MKIRIGALEIIDPSWEELEQLIQRFGGDFQSSDIDEGENSELPRRRNGGASAAASDRVVLERLISAGNAGIPTQELGEILGRRGKSIRPGLQAWAVRIGLLTDKNIDPFEETRVGSRRGARLKPSFQPVARELLNRL